MVTEKLRRWRDRGAAAVEFALVMPLLVMLLFGIAEFGNAFFIKAQVAGAARVAVRNYAINWKTTTAEDTVARDTATAIAKSAVPDPSASAVISPCVTASSQTTLVVTYHYQSMTGLFDWVLGSNSVPVIVKASMACGG